LPYKAVEIVAKIAPAAIEIFANPSANTPVGANELASNVRFLDSLDEVVLEVSPVPPCPPCEGVGVEVGASVTVGVGVVVGSSVGVGVMSTQACVNIHLVALE
jgi:hypothetical protein